VEPTLEVIPVIVALLNATGEIMRGFVELPIPKEAAVQRPTVLSTTMFVAEVDVEAVVTADWEYSLDALLGFTINFSKLFNVTYATPSTALHAAYKEP
jgi:hypothetical protein